jgi:UDP-glucose:(heptosyl)LPS alpha-1,3-glucosyltransferase
LKIAVVRPHFLRAKGGAEHYAVELVTGLVGQGHAVHVFAHRWDLPEEPGVSYHRVGMVRKPAWLRVLTFHRDLRRALVHKDYDIVLGMTPFAPQMVFWLGDGLYRVWTRMVWPLGLIRWIMCARRAVMSVNLWFERRALGGGADHFIVNSELVKRQAMAHYRIPEDRVSVVYPGVDLTRFNPAARAQWRAPVRAELGIDEADIVLLFVSNNFARKGLKTVFRSFAALSREYGGIRLLVVGSGRAWYYRRLARLLGIENQVTFVASASAFERYCAAADLFVLPTRYDPFAFVCLAAMATGLPVVTTRMNGAAELIQDGASGYLLDLRDAERQLTDRLDRLLDAERRAGMGLQAALTAHAFSLEAHVRRMVAVLGRVAEAQAEQRSLEMIRSAPAWCVNRDYLPLLERHQLASYAALVEARAAAPMDYNKKRIFVFRLDDGEKPVRLYLKRHRIKPSIATRLLRLIGITVPSDGMKEWNNLLAFQRLGLAAAVPVAAGERSLPDGSDESFIATVGLNDYAELDTYVTERLQPPLGRLQLRKSAS